MLLILVILIYAYIPQFGLTESKPKAWEYDLPDLEYIYDICAVSDNIYGIGTKYDNYQNPTPQGNNFLLIKITKSGTHQWTRLLEKEGDQWANRMVCDGSFLYTVGDSYSTGFRELFIVKWDLEGNEIWNKSVGEIPEFTAIDSIVVNNNRLYMCNNAFSSNANNITIFCFSTDGLMIWNRTHSEDSSGISMPLGHTLCILNDYLYFCGESNADNLLLKCDLDGNLLWNQTWGTVAFEKLIAIQTDHQNLFVTGALDSKTYVAKLNSSGELIWENVYTERDGNYPVCIDVDDSDELEVIVGGLIKRGPMSSSSFLVKWSHNGEYKLAGSFNGRECQDVIIENATIFACDSKSIVFLLEIPPFWTYYIPGYNIGIVFVVSSLCLVGIMVKSKKIDRSNIFCRRSHVFRCVN